MCVIPRYAKAKEFRAKAAAKGWSEARTDAALAWLFRRRKGIRISAYDARMQRLFVEQTQREQYFEREQEQARVARINAEAARYSPWAISYQQEGDRHERS